MCLCVTCGASLLTLLSRSVQKCTSTYYRKDGDNFLNTRRIVWINLSQESMNPRSLKMQGEEYLPELSRFIEMKN